ncbi:DUF2997 domain-containing protein [Candidatus Methanodesulfokora washburnensis]|uniref:DUF2997 domain-containing protein n=1 Tax=Candidatus Methanodesulfokora washburnensis TaxID=2478471 RepID=A0A3R9PJV7_9CREN|nr:DUF2997 domain-containing protein [Candidatus Methanodesulfokores washburnensis]RSN75429.1 DUF2997 domain-containing protein [Candidatus Methanodesulfokores washburnensis]
MREIKVEIDENGKVKILYSGFAGGACFEEAKKLYTLLKAQGLDVTIEATQVTPEFYSTASAAKVKEVNGG